MRTLTQTFRPARGDDRAASGIRRPRSKCQGNPQDNPLGWPAGTIKLIVPYPPGGSTDVIARLVQPCLQQRLGTTVIIENRAGGVGKRRHGDGCKVASGWRHVAPCLRQPRG